MSLYGDTSLPPPANPKRSGALLRIIIIVVIKNHLMTAFKNSVLIGAKSHSKTIIIL